MKIISGIVVSSLLLLGCETKHEKMRIDELREFVSNVDNGLTVNKNNAGFSIEVTIKPNDLIVQQQVEKGTQNEIDSITNELARYLYLTIDIRKDGKDMETWMASRSMDFARGITYLSSDFAQQISMNVNHEILRPVEYLYTRSYGLTGSRFLVVFERPDNDFEISIQGDDLGFGDMTFPFHVKNIKNIPSLLFTEI